MERPQSTSLRNFSFSARSEWETFLSKGPQRMPWANGVTSKQIMKEVRMITIIRIKIIVRVILTLLMTIIMIVKR